MEERRRRHMPTDAVGFLHQLPALTLLDRLPTAVLGVGLLGDIAYVNPAFAGMLGFSDGWAVDQTYLPDLLTGHERRAPGDCVDTLRTASPPSVVEWNHAHGYVIQTVLSPPLLLRATDTLLLISISDVTDALWESRGPSTSRQMRGRSKRTEGHGPPRFIDRQGHC